MAKLNYLYRKYIITALAVFFLVLSFHISALGQSGIPYANKTMFLSGINVAWVNFSDDLGPNPPALSQFRKEFQTVRDSGGNALRLWLFTNGSKTPAYNSSGFVTGPGPVAIQNLKQILSLAHHYNVGLILCLWSFDMLRVTELDSLHLNANIKMLTDTAYTGAFIRNALIPLVDSVKGDSAIIAWEVCNEPNGMTTGMNYYPADPTVSAAAVQQFTNLIAGAIHRTDPGALVTTGPGSFQTLTDVNPVSKVTALHDINSMPQEQLQSATDNFNAGHITKLTPQQMKDYLTKIAATANTNLYRDDRLIAAGGDSLGTLDFYCVHYYYYGSSALSPFTHQFSYWGLNKPTVVAEFYMAATDGMPDANLFPALYLGGYAGALVWSWTDFPNTPNNSANAANDTWKTLRYMQKYYGAAVNPFKIAFPSISIISPKNNTSISDSTQITITAAVVDTGAAVSYVEFFSADSSLGKITAPSGASSDTMFYSFVVKDVAPGNYNFSAIAENDFGQQEISSQIQVTLGTVPLTKLEAEQASLTGSGIILKSDPTASGGAFYDVATNDTNATITWRFTNYSDAGVYPVTFGFKLNYASPKSQYINVNNVRTDTVVFSGSTTQWLTKTIDVNLVKGFNSIQMQMFWGWMYVDYLAVPSSIVTSVEAPKEIPAVFSLSQNYPNPFNPSTTINYSIPKEGLTTLKIFDMLGREVRTLVNTRQKSGSYSVTFNAESLASGIYFYTINSGGYIQTKKMILLK